MVIVVVPNSAYVVGVALSVDPLKLIQGGGDANVIVTVCPSASEYDGNVTELVLFRYVLPKSEGVAENVGAVLVTTIVKD